MSLTTSQEEKLHRALGLLVDATPPVRELGDLVVPRADRTRARRSGPAIALATLVAVLALFVPLLLRSNSSSTTAVTAVEPNATTTAAAPQGPDGGAGFPVVQEVPGTDDLVALERARAYISHDRGETWDEIPGTGGADLLGLAPDGAVVAVRNGRDPVRQELWPDVDVWDAPQVMRYDPVVGGWDSGELPQPDWPLSGSSGPVATDEACVVGAFWKWGAQAVATGNEMVILGEHRIASGDVCEEGVQFAWTSADGETWRIVDDLGIDGHPVGLTWFEDRYVAYGSQDEWFTWLLRRTPEIWSSTDLVTWERAVLDLSPMPDMGYISAFPDSERPWSPDSPTVDVETAGNALGVSFQVDIALPGPHAGISSVAELADWLLANRGSEYFDPDLDVIEQLEADLAMASIDFPLDDEEVDQLWHGYAAADRAGRFVAETTDGITWTTRYEE